MSRNNIISAQELKALADALADEYMAHETYTQVIRDFGEIQPFSNILEAEARHVAALVTLFEHYGLSVPPNRWPGKVPRYPSIHEACIAGVQAEINNAALYDQLIASTRRPDILEVFKALRSASEDHHLPAFQRCVQRLF